VGCCRVRCRGGWTEPPEQRGIPSTRWHHLPVSPNQQSLKSLRKAGPIVSRGRTAKKDPSARIPIKIGMSVGRLADIPMSGARSPLLRVPGCRGLNPSPKTPHGLHAWHLRRAGPRSGPRRSSPTRCRSAAESAADLRGFWRLPPGRGHLA